MVNTEVAVPDLDAEQLAAVTAIGNVFVDAGPGTGKTHVIVARIRHLVASGVDPRRILAVTFSRRAVGELRDRIARETGFTCDVRTFHGFASRVLEADGPRFKSRRLLDALTNSLLLDAAIARTAFPSLRETAVASDRFRDDALRFIADVRRADGESVRRLRDGCTPRLRDLLALNDKLVELRDTLRASDLDDLIARAVESLSDETSVASRWLTGRYHHVLIDEFQDVDATQLELVARLKANLFAVGDASQAIYAFRGALSGVIDEAVTRFEMERIVLTKSRRCPQVICDLAAITPFLAPKHLRSIQHSVGTIAARAARTTLDEAVLIVDRVEDAIAAGTMPSRIAVLVRSMRPLGPAVEAELRSRRIAVASGGRSAFLADRNVETVRLGLRLLAAPSEAGRWAAFFGTGTLGFDGLRVRSLFHGRSLATLEDGLLALEEARFASADPSIDVPKTLRHANEAFAANDIGRAARRLINGLGLAASAASSSEELATVRANVGRLGRVVDALSAAQRNLTELGEASSSATVLTIFEDRIETIAAEETPADDVPGVRLLTIHGAKGLEFDLVIIGDAVEGRFPAEVRRCSLLDTESIAAAALANVDLIDARDDASLHEEAALWYVAVTRTRDALFITYSVSGTDGAPQRPTRFLPAEKHPNEDQDPFERPLGRLEDVARENGDANVIASLRASLADAPARLAVLDDGPLAFAALEERNLRYDRAPSVSAAEVWLECPRRFYYKNVLRLDDEAGLSATIGSALHEILRAFHTEFADFSAPAAVDVPRWIARLLELREAVWTTIAFDSAAKRVAYTMFADRVLAAYAGALAEDAEKRPFTVIALEQSVQSTYGTGAMVGKIDRVDRTIDGSLVLRDYKSGRMREPFAKLLAKIDDGGVAPGKSPRYFKAQLAIYRHGAEKAFGAPVTGLDYIFLNGVKGKEAFSVGFDAFAVDDDAKPRLEALDKLLESQFVTPLSTGMATPIEMAVDENTCMFCPFFKALCPGPKC
jgi:superfamily I DNA/RNA helicase/RecB family exonuclease